MIDRHSFFMIVRPNYTQPLDFTAVFSRPVPLWTAKSMLKQGKCRLASDECGGILSMHRDRMNIERMRRILQVERNSELPQVSPTWKLH